MANGLEASDTSISSSHHEQLSSSHLLSSSVSSFSSSKRGSSISKVYRQASTLFLTRRLKEAISTIEPLVREQTHDSTIDGPDKANDDTENTKLPPIATASRSARVKIWSLYISIINAIIELGPEEGKNTFGCKEWKALSSKARDGSIWEEVVTNGYKGREGDVDSDVVINLATLLLSHSPTQSLTQQRLETFLSSSSVPNIDFAAQLATLNNADFVSPQQSVNGNGANTPRELNSRIKILEIYTLHVLPRNDEWDYAEQLIGISEFLDDERREAFLQTLQSLKDEASREQEKEAVVLQEQQARLEQERKDAEARRIADSTKTESSAKRIKDAGGSDHPSSNTFPKTHKTSNGPISGREHPAANPSNNKFAKPGTSSRSQISPSPESRSSIRKREQPSGPNRRATSVMGSFQKLVTEMARSISGNPMALIKMIIFLVGLVLTFSRRDIRERIRKLTGSGWDKIKNTVGMGVKVSYI